MSTAASVKAIQTTMPASRDIVRVPRRIWHPAAIDHQRKIQSLLEPTLLPHDNIGKYDTRHIRSQRHLQKLDWIRPLDPQNPVCNFLIEYYGLKGFKGVKRLARWSPSPNLLCQDQDHYDNLEEFQLASISGSSNTENNVLKSGVLLEDVQEDDFSTLLHMRGAMAEESSSSPLSSSKRGALYSPNLWFQQKLENRENQKASPQQPARGHPASPFLWYRSILQQTLETEPILHCHGLHEWAMQYHPEGHPPPPSAKYQSHLPLRVSRQVINETVERKGISCTHVDALRFFAPAAGPLNHHGSELQRTDQLRLEQPACVHAQMDLLKIVLRLQPFCDANLLRRILALSMEARQLDVAASPYDATSYGVGVVPVETEAGRALYRKQQRALMAKAEPIRRELLDAYNILIRLAFEQDPDQLEGQATPSSERYAKAEPGGKPWRQNLLVEEQKIIVS